MGLFDFLKGKKNDIKIEMVGYESGRRVDLQDKNLGEDKSDWKRQMSIQLTLNSEIKPIEDAMVGFAVALKSPQRVDDEIVMLESLIEHYEEIKQKCYALGPDYIEYFTRSWAEIRSGRDDGPEYVTRYKKRLKYLLENREELVAQENLHEKELGGLEGRVLDVIKSSPGILQTDVYNHFHSIVKRDVQNIIYSMEKNGTIKREKSGRTYMIHYIK